MDVEGGVLEMGMRGEESRATGFELGCFFDGVDRGDAEEVGDG